MQGDSKVAILSYFYCLNVSAMYFPELNKLLFEPDFVKFISVCYACYLEVYEPQKYYSADPDGELFNISMVQWYDLNDNTKGFKEESIAYTKRSIITKDWAVFNAKMDELITSNPKQFQEEFEALKKEINYLKNRIAAKEYFKPITEGVFDEFDRIISHYDDYTGSAKRKPAKEVIAPNIDPLIWHGGVGSLCTFFDDLTKLKLPDGNPLLSASTKQLVDFILHNFIDEKGERFEYNSVRDYIYKEGKKVSRNRVILSLSGEKK